MQKIHFYVRWPTIAIYCPSFPRQLLYIAWWHPARLVERYKHEKHHSGNDFTGSVTRHNIFSKIVGIGLRELYTTGHMEYLPQISCSKLFLIYGKIYPWKESVSSTKNSYIYIRSKVHLTKYFCQEREFYVAKPKNLNWRPLFSANTFGIILYNRKYKLKKIQAIFFNNTIARSDFYLNINTNALNCF